MSNQLTIIALEESMEYFSIIGQGVKHDQENQMESSFITWGP